MNRQRSKTVLSARRAGAALIAILVLVKVGLAADFSLTREVILRDERYGALMIEPRTILHVEDGGFVIAGGIPATQSAWAVRKDAEGKVLWRYDVSIRDKLPHGNAAKFEGATAMPDGSVYLCGSMPRPPSESIPALLAHVDAAGRPLAERLLTPSENLGAEVSISHFNQCLRWGEGIVIIGSVKLFHRSAAEPGTRDRSQYYWIVMLKGDGDVAWEKLIPTSLPNGVIEGVDSAQIASDGSLLLVGYRSPASELLRIGANGELLARKKLFDQYWLVKGVVTDGRLQIFGGAHHRNHELLTLNDRLDVVKQTNGKRLSAFLTHEVYRLPDESLVLFGASSGAPSLSRAVWLSATLDSERHIDLARKPYADGGFIAAATPTGTAGEFATV